MMKKSTFIEKVKQNPKLKSFILNFIIHPVKTRPQWWIRLFMPFYIKKGKNSIIYNSVRKDIVPFNSFCIGAYSVIEDYSCINNAVGCIHIGNHTRIGLCNTIIGPVKIGNNVNLAQGVVVSALNHNYQDISKSINLQGVSTSEVIIEDDVWIAANCVITPGVVIGKHVVVAGGSVVVKSIPPYSVVAGNPAKIIKQYDFKQQKWIRIASNNPN